MIKTSYVQNQLFLNRASVRFLLLLRDRKYLRVIEFALSLPRFTKLKNINTWILSKFDSSCAIQLVRHCDCNPFKPVSSRELKSSVFSRVAKRFNVTVFVYKSRDPNR